MPCYDPGPTDRDTRSRVVAMHLIYVFTELRRGEEITDEMRTTSEAYYGNHRMLDTFTELLCSTLRSLSPEDFEKVVYNPRSYCSRRLADWWEDHDAFDKQRDE